MRAKEKEIKCGQKNNPSAAKCCRRGYCVVCYLLGMKCISRLLTSPEMRLRPDPVQWWWTTCGSLCQSVADQIISHVEDEPKSGSEDDYYTVEHENELWIIVIINLWVLLVLAPLLDPMDH